MHRCAVERANGVIRIGILCTRCSGKALTKTLAEARRFWSAPYDGESECEACGEQLAGVA